MICLILIREVQFSFKENTDCADAIFTLKSSVEYLVKHDSFDCTVSLYIIKAIDLVNHVLV